MPKRIVATSEDELKFVVNIVLSFCVQRWTHFRERGQMVAVVPCLYNGLTGIQVTTWMLVLAHAPQCSRNDDPYLYSSTASYNSPILSFALRV